MEIHDLSNSYLDIFHQLNHNFSIYDQLFNRFTYGTKGIKFMSNDHLISP